jgi:SAM-dependent methyltransferase
MVITEHFAWAHLPKAAGSATQDMLEAVPGLVLWAQPQDTNDKHDPFWRHEEAVAGKLLVMNIRRLPSWILSMAHHKATAGIWPDYEPQPMPTVEEMTESRLPDDTIRYMTEGPRFPVDHWLRQESLTDDLTALLEQTGSLTDEARAAIGGIPFLAKPYDHDVNSTFSPEQIQRMYMLNPAWAEVERRVFGDIVDFGAPPPPPPRSRTRRLLSKARSTTPEAQPGSPEERPEPVPADDDDVEVDSWLTHLFGPEIGAIDDELARVGPSYENFKLFRGLDDDVWALLLGRRYTTYKSILETLPHLPDPDLQMRWNGAQGLELLNQSKSFYRHCKTMLSRHGSVPLEDALILDFGCGWGRLARFFSRDVEPGAVHGCDPVEEILEVCRRCRLPAVLHRTEFVPERLPVEGFDLAYSFSVFTHLSEPAAQACLRALHGALAPGGILILTIRPPGYLDRDPQLHATRDALGPDFVAALSEPRYLFVPHDADPGHPQYQGGEMTYGEAVISLPYVRERWSDLFELVDVGISTEDLHQVPITLRKR